MQLNFPPLVLSEPIGTRWFQLACFLVLGSLIAEVLLVNLSHYSAWIFLWTVVPLILVVLVSRLLEPWRTRIAQPTMRDFTLEVLMRNQKKFSGDTGINRKDMEVIMNRIIVNKIGVDPIEIAPEKSLTRDLGID